MQERDGRRGKVFPIRLRDDERLQLERFRAASAGPRALGPWMIWAARFAAIAKVLPGMGTRAGNTAPRPARATSSGITRSSVPNEERVILDLCAGSGAWSAPYKAQGYQVYCVTLPDLDVRTWKPPKCDVWGVLAAPPCTEFSLAKNGSERDIRSALEVVSACTRIICATRPKWWAIENPVGLLSHYFGTARDVWEPFEFGDPWTKRTAVWGDFTIPERGPFVKPLGSAMDRATPALRAVTPPGFARAFFEANP
jgi:hypothetical protein